jgi:hypothetical protein
VHRIERDILSRAHRLAAIEPTPEASARAVSAALAAVAFAPRPKVWVRQATLRLGLAAAIVMMVATGANELAKLRTPPADKLHQIMQNNWSYQGWMHVVLQNPLPGELPDLGNATAGGPLVTTEAIHTNTADGTQAISCKRNGVPYLVMRSPVKGELVRYDGARNEILITRYTPRPDDGGPAIEGFDLVDTASRFVGGDVEHYELQYQRDGKQDRFDIGLYETSDPKSEPAPDENLTVWVDPRSKLIRKLRTETASRTSTSAFSYGQPVIRNIYDLGAPLDAKVIDRRQQTAPALSSSPLPLAVK